MDRKNPKITCFYEDIVRNFSSCFIFKCFETSNLESMPIVTITDAP